MNIHIGLMIWKELKNQHLSIAAFANLLGITKTNAQKIINTDLLDIPLLIRISEVLKYNFFQYYESGASFKKMAMMEKQSAAEEIKALKALLMEKNKVLELKNEFIKRQSNMIDILEKNFGK